LLNILRAAALVLVLMAGAGAAEPGVYTIGAWGGLSTITGGDSLTFPMQFDYGVRFGYYLKKGWSLDFDLSRYRWNSDSTASSSFAFGSGDDHAVLRYSAVGVGVTATKLLFRPEASVNVPVGLGVGVMFWRGEDPRGDTTWTVPGTGDEKREFKSSELFVRAMTGIDLHLKGRLGLGLEIHADYLTAIGADFADEVNKGRDRLVAGVRLGLQMSFGARRQEVEWRSEPSWARVPPSQRSERDLVDSDGDGVPDKRDKCPNTPLGAVVDMDGCPIDSDGDGVPDGLDDCPDTPAMARGMVDMFGCPVDSDFDGIPDYLDECPYNPVGAHVDSVGCPIDSDGDGVPDGLDDCPNTLYGVEVDGRGCIDLSVFDKPMVLNIDYTPGSFEIDPTSKERLKRLSRLLHFVSNMRLEINGYTDNIGMAQANQALSEKRANRVRDYLVAQGIEAERMTVYGRGETNFVASNETAEGRARNRRVEIVFYK